jgi:NAD(P)-dependent dehydrogenase (short-subunit alcohol dehydrogenase family)
VLDDLASTTDSSLETVCMPAEIAAVAFLASDDASFVNGVTLPVDGDAQAVL